MPPPDPPLLPYHNPIFRRARRFSIGGLFLFGGFLILMGLVLAFLVYTGDTSAHPILFIVAIPVFLVGTGDVLCAALIFAGRRSAIPYAFILVAFKAAGVLSLIVVPLIHGIFSFDALFYMTLLVVVVVLVGLAALIIELNNVRKLTLSEPADAPAQKPYPPNIITSRVISHEVIDPDDL